MMTIWLAPLLAGALGASAQGPAVPVPVPARIESRGVERLYNDAILKDGTIDRVSTQLATQCADPARSRRARANACLLRSHLEWRHGRMTPAIEAIEAGLLVEPYDDLVYYKARLFDADGKAEVAKAWYQKALDLTTNVALRETIQLRLTFSDAVKQNVSGIMELARTRPREFRNRAAIALAILDFDKEAAELYQVYGEGSERFRQHVRVAQWAIQARDAAKAQDEAWQAVRMATFDRDINYGLSLLVEAHMLDASLDRLLARLGQQKTLTPQEQRVQVDLLRQTGRFTDAIALFTSAHGQDLAPDLRRELLRMYREAGEDAAMVAEYGRLIAAEPALTDWAEGLSQYYLEQADHVNARKVWEDFLGRNAEVDTLLFGADAMTSFGFHDLAIAATEKAIARNTGPEDAARVRLAQFELHRQRGLNDEAERALAALDALLPQASPFRVELADAFERIQKPQLAARTLEALGVARGGLSIDERMRLAWLLDSTGRRDDALAVWKSLWTSESLAARRKLVEERLLMLAAELGTLGDLAVELEEKLTGGTASPRDVSLLVSIYTKVGDSVSAIEVVTSAAAAAGTTAVESLKEQAQIYLALAEYPEFTRVTRQLMEVDPDNKINYLQSLLLNQIEAGGDATRPGGNPDEESAQLRGWLAQLRKVGGEAAGAEFEAGVLDLAGFRDQAIEAYRRALAQHPDRADDHLLLADLLRQAGRQAEAITSLQYITETAETDELFLIAIDGIGNMRTASPDTMKWAQRRALERLITRDDKLYLYEMLAELAEETKDAKGYIAALEASLAHADSRRSHVLRELLAATADITTYEASLRTGVPNADLNLAYGRRLIALGEELPPDVYMDLGRTFIKMNDPAAARRAFDMAVDRTGRSSIVVEAAKLFERGGYDREAIREYERALVADSTNLETMMRLARVRERAGATSTANELYLRAMVGVLSRQNRAVERGQERTPPALDGLLSFEYKRYYTFVLAGFLSTLPDAPDARHRRLVTLEEAFGVELQQVARASAPLLPLAYYPRLTVLAQTLRAASFAAGAPAAADRADAALLQRFSADPEVVRHVTADRERWGYPAPASGAAVVAVASATPERARDSSDYLRDVGLALTAGDQDAAMAVYRQWARFAAAPKPPIFIGNTELPDRSPGLPEVAAHAWPRLDERRFANLAQHIHGLVTDSDPMAEKMMLDLIYQYEVPDVPILTRVERALGRPLIEEERLLGLINRRADWSLLNMTYVLSHLTGDRQLSALERYAKAPELNWMTFLKSLGVVLWTPLEPARATRFMAITKAAFQTVLKRGSGPQILPNFMNYPFTAGIHASNAPLVLEMEQFLAERHPLVFKTGYFKATLLKDLGRDLEAVAEFVDAALKMYAPMPPVGTAITPGMPSPYAYQAFVRAFGPFLFPKYKTELLARLQEKEREPSGLTDALISLRIELNTADPASNAGEFLAALQGIADRHPANELVRNTLHPLYDQWGDTMKAIAVLTELTRLRPEHREYRYRLLSLWQKLDYPEQVTAVAGANTVAELAPVVARNYYIEAVTGAPTVRFPLLKRALDQIKATTTGGDPAQAALGLRTLLQTLPPAGMSLSEYGQTRDQADPYLYVRDFLLLEGEPPPKAGATDDAAAPVNPNDRVVRSLQLPAADVAPRAAKLTAVVGRSAFGIAELEAYLSNLRAADIDKQYVFITMLVDAYASSGRADEELRRRAAQAASGQMGQKDLTIWLGLAAKQTGERARELAASVEQRGLATRATSGLQRVFLARLYAAADRGRQALDTYVSVATTVLAGTANTLQANTLQVDGFGRDNGMMLFTGLGLFDEVRDHVDADGLAAFVAQMLALSRPPDGMAVQQAYGRFVNILYVRASMAGLVIPALQTEAVTIAEQPTWTRGEVLQAAYVRAHLGRMEEALALLQRTVRREFEAREPINTVQSNAMFAARLYQVALGLVGDTQALGPFGTGGAGIEELKPLFPLRADEWTGAGAWVARVATTVPEWIARGTANRDAGIQVLALTALRLQQMGDIAGARSAARSLTTVLREGLVSTKAAGLAVSIADMAGAPVDLPVLQDLVRANRLPISATTSVLTRTVAADGAEAALRLGADAARFTSNEELLRQLQSIAETAGNIAEAERWTARREAAAAARARLAKKPA